MPILKSEQKTRKILLPDSGANVTIFDGITFGKMVEIRTIPTKENSMIPIIAALVIDWDITNENNEKLSINDENIKKLSKDDGDLLLEEISKNFVQKKTSDLK